MFNWLNTEEALKGFVEGFLDGLSHAAQNREQYLKEKKEFWEKKKLEFYKEEEQKDKYDKSRI